MSNHRRHRLEGGGMRSTQSTKSWAGGRGQAFTISLSIIALTPAIAEQVSTSILDIDKTSSVPARVTLEADSLEEMVVTATHREANSRSTSSSLTVIDAEQLQAPKLTTDFLNSQIGVYLQETTPGQGAAIIRGLKGSSILHLVDGMRMNNAIFRSAPTQYLAFVPVSAVQRVEVIRGASTSLYGSDAVGGAINLVTHRPQFRSLQTAIRGNAYLSFDSAELNKTARVNIDVGNRRIAASFNLEHVKNGNRRKGEGVRNIPSAYHYTAARALLSGSLSEHQSWTIDLQYLDQPATPRVDELIPGFEQELPSSSEFMFSPNTRVFAHANYKIESNINIEADLAWQRIDDGRITRDFGALNRTIESNSSGLFGLTLRGSKSTERGSWVVGSELYYDTVSSQRLQLNLASGSIGAVSARYPDNASVTKGALYGHLQRQLSNRHSLNIGLRLSYNSIHLPASNEDSQKRISDTNYSGDLGWSFDLTEDLQFVSNLGVGFRAPNVFDLGSLGNRPGNRFNIPNLSLTSEQVNQFDLGVRYFSNQLKFEISAFKLSYSDQITSIGTGKVTSAGRDIVQSVNATRSSIRGVEAGLSYQPNERFQARATLNFTEGQQSITPTSTEPADRIPPLNGQLWFQYQTHENYTLETWLRFADAQRQLSSRDIQDARISPEGTAGWNTLGARIQKIVNDAWTMSITLDNIFDRNYRVHGSGVNSVGRNVILRLDIRF